MGWHQLDPEISANHPSRAVALCHGLRFRPRPGRLVWGMSKCCNALQRHLGVGRLQLDPEISANQPARAKQSAMAYDSVHGQVVLFGGRDITSNVFRVTLGCGTAPTGRRNPRKQARWHDYHTAMAYDSMHDQVVVFGGRGVSSGFLDDTWTWDGGFPLASSRGPSISNAVSASAFGGFSSVAPGRGSKSMDRIWRPTRKAGPAPISLATTRPLRSMAYR